MPNKATLTVYNQSGNPHGWAPVEINGQKLQTNAHGIFDLTNLIGRSIQTLMINGTMIPIGNPLKITEGMKLEAHVRDRTLKILDSQEASPTLSTN